MYTIRMTLSLLIKLEKNYISIILALSHSASHLGGTDVYTGKRVENLKATIYTVKNPDYGPGPGQDPVSALFNHSFVHRWASLFSPFGPFANR
jgi:hypothetical protein